MKKKVGKALVGTMALLMAFSAVGCGGNDAGDRTQIAFRCEVTGTKALMEYANAIKAYNNGKGKEDGVYVNAIYNASSGDLGTSISSASEQTPNVVSISDSDFKQYSSLGYLLDLDDYLTPTAKEAMEWDNIPDMYKYRFCYSLEENAELGGKKEAGKGTDVRGLPNGSNPLMLFYNKKLLKNENINVISIAETELAGTNYKPHGYAEYKVAPADGLVASTNNAGQTVYKVFNDKIPMNWEEFRYLMQCLKKTGKYQYSYMSEYWFEYGWSVGGDCIGWDATKNEYVLTLGDKDANYLATKDVTVNGTAYKAGDVLNYEDMKYVHANPVDAEAGLCELPSMYDAFLEYNRIGVPTDEITDYVGGTGVMGYGFAPNRTGDNERYFNAETSPFVTALFSRASVFASANVGANAEMAPQQQYREYVGGSLVNDEFVAGAIDNIQVKVIGETYGGEVYTGELKKVNGTPVVGRVATNSMNSCLAIAKNSPADEYEAAFKFASWLAGPDGQKLVAKGSLTVPNQTTISFSADYLNASDRINGNVWAASYVSQGADMGDWAYFNDGSWVTQWSETLNNAVRQGTMTIADFLEAKEAVANNALKEMGLRVYRR